MMTMQEWQDLLDERFPNGANICAVAEIANHFIIPRLMVAGEGEMPDGTKVVDIIAIPVTMERDFLLRITEMAESAQGTILKGVNQSWFVSDNVPVEGERGEALKKAREYEVFTTPMWPQEAS